ncbi:MAG: Crp/Fnr family transcriptional regulator [Tissierellia bacterium]|nr:Crp/Fnr family transcriptional regulator [Tissierellia bacterium]
MIDPKLLKDASLFEGLDEKEISALQHCMKFDLKTYKKDEIILHNGDTVESIGLVMDGSVIVERYDFWGNKNIWQLIDKNDIFAESFAAIQGQELIFNIIAKSDAKIVFIETSKIITTCSRACSFHTKFISNLLKILARKNLNLSNKIIHTSEKSIRSRVMNYLSDQAFKNKSQTFTIPFNRQEMADYLLVDRSALSKELSKMKEDGIIDFWKNQFKLKKIINL